MTSLVPLLPMTPVPGPFQPGPPQEDGGFAYILDNWREIDSGRPVPIRSSQEASLRRYGDAYDPIRNSIDASRWILEVAQQVRTFSAFFRSRMRAAGIDSSQTFTITTDACGHFSVQGTGETPSKVQALLNQDPELAYAYRSIQANCGEAAEFEVGCRYSRAWKKAVTDRARFLVYTQYKSLFEKVDALSDHLDFRNGEFSSPAMAWAQALPMG